MGVLTIRANRRYAMRLPVMIRQARSKASGGLLIEISQEGARVSNLGKTPCAEGEALTIVTPDGTELPGTIRWAHDGLAGIKLEKALHLPELTALLDDNRRELAGSERRFGT